MPGVHFVLSSSHSRAQEENIIFIEITGIEADQVIIGHDNLNQEAKRKQSHASKENEAKMILNNNKK